jgi:ankyrin repeat protein
MTRPTPLLRILLSLIATFVLAVPSANAGEIHDLIKNNEIEKVKSLLAKNAKLKGARDDLLQTPLHVAAAYGRVEIVKLLLDRGAELDVQAYNQFAPLHLTENLEIVKLLIAHKADLEAMSAGGTALQRAADRSQRGNEESVRNWRAIAKALLDAGAKYDLLSATCLGDLDRVKAVLKDDPKQALNREVMREAARGGRTEIVGLLLANKADPNDAEFGGMPVLYFALPHPETVRLLIKAGADAKSHLKDKRLFGSGPMPTGTLLHQAARKRLVETAKILIEADIEIDARDANDWTALGIAAALGWPEFVKLLLEHGASVKGKYGSDAIAAAARNIRYPDQDAKEIARYKAIIVLLQSKGATVDLSAAVALGDLDRVKALLKTKQDWARDKDSREKPVLEKAVDLDRKEIVVALLDAGAPIDGKDERGSTALHSAAFWGREEIAKLLIARRAEIDARDDNGGTPLHESARLGSVGVARLLLAAGADVNARAKDGRTARLNANVAKNSKELLELFEKYGARP